MVKTYGIISIVLGFISIMLSGLNAMQTPQLVIMVPVFITSVVGIIFDGRGISRDDSKGLGIAGLLLGIIGLAFPLWLVINILLIHPQTIRHNVDVR